MEHIIKYFPALTEKQLHQFALLDTCFRDWNSKINLISRKDIDNLEVHHILHSLSIAKFASFKPNTEILDIGTGGGFPGIPLAILFPECKFTLIDSIAKKIMVVNELKSALQLTNVTALTIRAEQHKNKYDFILSRAVSSIEDFIPYTRGKFKRKSVNALHNGIIYLKGGSLTGELKNEERKYAEIVEISSYFEEPYFETKKIVYLPRE